MKPEESGIWFTPTQVLRLPGGETLLRPGKPVLRAKASETARMTGVHRKVLAALADCGLIRRAMPSPGNAHYYPAEVAELIRRTEEDPDFWNTVRTRAYLRGERLQDSKPSGD